ncbi:uncharacterized protein J3D65DRAFT_609642 [Phyllosticta citribraziliensis]|uniref:Apple domain-containing protein n=1 Tax=Phyllosticta citribraziliensis TaxID=989973 RepID=A0ABR1M987_9PEZI
MMRISIFISLLVSLVALVAGQNVATLDKTSGAEVKGDCGIVGFQKPGEFNAFTKDTPLEVKDRKLPFRYDILDCIANCKKQLGPDGCGSVLWSLKFAQCGISSTKFDSNINRDVRGDHLFYKPECYDQIKDPKKPLDLIVQGQN